MAKPIEPALAKAPPFDHAIDKSLREVSRIAEIPNECRAQFLQGIRAILIRSWGVPIPGDSSPTELGNQLKQISNAVERIIAKLEASRPSVTDYIDAMLWDSGSEHTTKRYNRLLKTLHQAVESAEADVRDLVKIGRPGGLRNPFDVFIFQLIGKARACGGDLKIYKSAHAEANWNGSLLNAVRLLEPQLPRGFLPPGNLGQALDRVTRIAGRNPK